MAKSIKLACKCSKCVKDRDYRQKLLKERKELTWQIAILRKKKAESLAFRNRHLQKLKKQIAGLHDLTAITTVRSGLRFFKCKMSEKTIYVATDLTWCCEEYNFSNSVQIKSLSEVLISNAEFLSMITEIAHQVRHQKTAERNQRTKKDYPSPEKSPMSLEQEVGEYRSKIMQLHFEVQLFEDVKITSDDLKALRTTEVSQ